MPSGGGVGGPMARSALRLGLPSSNTQCCLLQRTSFETCPWCCSTSRWQATISRAGQAGPWIQGWDRCFNKLVSTKAGECNQFRLQNCYFCNTALPWSISRGETESKLQLSFRVLADRLYCYAPLDPLLIKTGACASKLHWQHAFLNPLLQKSILQPYGWSDNC